MRNTIAVLAASVTIVLAGCGDDTASAPEALEVPLDGYQFPDDLQVVSSGQVTFTSNDAEPHKIEIDGAGQTESFDAGEQASLPAPEDAGTYDMVCLLHPTMTGTLDVTDRP